MLVQPPETQTITTWMLILIGTLMTREMVRKGIALWKAGTKKQLRWFICMFIFNTAGLLPIIYLIFFQKKEQKVVIVKPTIKSVITKKAPIKKKAVAKKK